MQNEYIGGKILCNLSIDIGGELCYNGGIVKGDFYMKDSTKLEIAVFVCFTVITLALVVGAIIVEVLNG